MTNKPSFASYAALVAAMVFWGCSFIALKISFRAYHPMFIMFVRLLIASLVFLPFVKGFGKNYQKGDGKWLVLMALFEPCLYFSFEAEAVRLTSAAQAGMICAMLPVMVALPSAFYLKEKISFPMIIGFILAIGGSVWLSLISESSESAPRPMLGNMLEFVAMIWGTCYTISVRKLSTRYSALTLTAVQAFVGTPFFLIRMVLSPDSLPHYFAPGPFAAILFMALFVSVLAYSCYAYGIQNTSATTAALFINLIPVITLIASIVILKEEFSIRQLAASSLILGGVIVSQIKDRRIIRV
ncbi:MAG: DMT family transporter [Spirochaetales bacterium]|nr:DMT family transporter [Spirochaetales bacterium]